MLQKTNDWVNLDNMPSPEFRPAPVVSLVDVVAFLRRRLSIILLTCLATLGIATLYLIIVKPTFTAKAEIIVNSKETPGDAAAVSTIVESQIAIIRSESIASAVIEKLGLAQDPEFTTGQGSGMISRLLGWSRPETKASAVRYAVESFERRLSTKRVGPTYLVEITFDSKDPDRAAQILNAIVERYITYHIGNAQDETWTKDRLNELETQALAAQNALEDYRKNTTEPADSAATLDKLAAAAESSRNAYDNFRHMLRKMEAMRQQSSPVFEASLVTGASPPLRASSPKARIVLGAAIVVGGLLGIAIGMLRDLLESRAIGREPRLSAQADGIERPIPEPDHQSEASAKTRPVRLTGSG
jgi:uncharacterized protein involved in exopolysaccharide biosynthesis